MQNARRHSAVLPARSMAQKPHEKVGILASPTAEAGVEAVDRKQVCAPDAEVAGARPAPSPRGELAQRSERQRPECTETIDPALQPLGHPVRERPMFRLNLVAQDVVRQLARHQDAIAGHEPSGLSESAMSGYK